MCSEGTEQVEQRLVKYNAHHCEHEPADHQHEPGVGQNGPGAVQVLPAPGNGTQRRAAHTEQVGEGGDQGDEGKAQPKSGQRQRAVTGNFADVDPVHDIIQKVQDLGHQHGRRHCKHTPAHVGAGKIHLAAPGRMMKMKKCILQYPSFPAGHEF